MITWLLRPPLIPVFDVNAGVPGCDLYGVAQEIRKAPERDWSPASKPIAITLTGPIDTTVRSYNGTFRGMALALVEGGEPNAPVGRAVIGGSTFAMFATRVFGSAMFALLYGSTEFFQTKEKSYVCSTS
jgi:hypothetical protein